MEYYLKCTNCGAKYKNDCSNFRCTKCNSILEVIYEYNKLKINSNFQRKKPIHKKYADFFPIHSKLISMSEGGTPIADAKALLDDYNIKFMLKLETKNPTNSFKDRGSSVEITKAVEYGFDEICCASTGNMGLSLSTYAAKEGINCTVFMSESANKNKMHMIKEEGANIIKVKGDFNSSLLKAEKYSVENKMFLCGDYHYRKEGQKSVAYELIEQIKNIDYLFVQVGNATLISAIYKGFLEFKKFNLVSKIPKIIAVQSSECDPLIRAYKSNAKIHYMKSHTYADAIAVGYPTFGFEGIDAVKSTKGNAISVADKDIKNTRNALVKRLKISCESGGAVGVAGFLKMLKSNSAQFQNKTVCAIITGNNEGE
jgi:threonine synthase